MQAGMYLTALHGMRAPEARLCYERAESSCYSLNRPMVLYAAQHAPLEALIALAFEVGDNRAMRPCEHGRHNQADAFAAARRRVAEHMLRPVVAQRVDL
jgi:hypothetical protein